MNKETGKEQERRKAITLHPFYKSYNISNRSEHQELRGEDRMATEEIKSGSEMRNKKEAARKIS